ncbi:MAG: zinc-dependent peptidase [Gammaproteobacteria bacterium]|nr:zinc-dependent peptidase [Gammaproteobacteria bacterium]MBQ0840967.1 zinc-dependent peptidase [Gammaproteobacteria bacterium]
MAWLERQRIRYTLRHHAIPETVWSELMCNADVFERLSAVEREHLRELSTLFLHRKTLSGVQGFNVSTAMAVAIAAQACLLILKLGLEYYDGWLEVLVYPGAFRVERDVTDATGVVSHEARALSGESWSRGPVILSWDDIAAELAAPHPGHNVVLHEFAHKLDMLNGSANGMPPLHRDMVRTQWTRHFSQAFDQLRHRLAHHHRPGIDAYGATNPAEFFAVASEYFFTDPQTLKHVSPAIYEQLTLFYRQHPASP